MNAIMENKKLIILGNGFDLASGLKSSYYDFFADRISPDILNYLKHALEYFETNMFRKGTYFSALFDSEKYKRSKTYARVEHKIGVPNAHDKPIYDLLPASNLTFWDLVFFYSNTNKNVENYEWQDIEKKMLEFLYNPEGLENIPNIKSMQYYFRHVSNDQNIASQLCLHLACFLPEREKTYTADNFIEYLYDELRLFEKSFANYICKVSDETYQRNAEKNICRITQKSLPACKDQIFSFNYTDPFSVHGLNIVNVHGKAELDSILFGIDIDQDKVNPESESFRFTKTFRQMTETKLAKTYQDNILPSKNDIKEIIFFGHSLSKFDYSYFQTIFDYYDLYNSSVKLIFYYELYGSNTSELMELDLANKISKMLYSYSPSIDNPKKGQNLTHKLLLEKRLFIEKLKDLKSRNI